MTHATPALSKSLLRFAAAWSVILAFASKELHAQSYPPVTRAAQSPVDIPQTNLTPIQQPFVPPATYTAQPPPSTYAAQPPPNSYAAQPPPGGYAAPPAATYSAQPPSGFSAPPAATYTAPPAATYAPAAPAAPAAPGGVLPPTGYAAPPASTYSGGAYGPPPTAGGYSGLPPTLPPSQYTTPPPATFDPYQSPAGRAPTSTFGGGPTPSFGMGNPGFGTAPSPYNQPYAAPGYPPTAYPSSAPNSLYPTGIVPSGSVWGPTGLIPSAISFRRGPQLEAAWIYDDNDANAVGMTEFDARVGFALPDFFRSGQPLVISPGFGLTFLNGPNSSTGADLPGEVYSAYTDLEWSSDPNQIFSVDLGVRLGVFNDFDVDFFDGFRIPARAVGNFRLSPYTTFKAGVYYLDRNDVDWLPAIGVLYVPSATTRADIFFPEPKISNYLTTFGTSDVWWYIGGEYGGGNWEIRRASGKQESVDINDIRVVLGLEWGRNDLLRSGVHTGFVELGYVFDRELYYSSSTYNNIKMDDTFMIRGGINF